MRDNVVFRGRAGWVGRMLRALAQVAVISALGVASTGCGALSALTNPEAAWAFEEPAPMSVVVRRAELAHETAEQVDRLMGKTPVDDESTWVPETSLKKDEAQALLASFGTNDTYNSAKGQKLRVTVAEAYVSRFTTICSDEEQHQSLLAATSDKLQPAFDEIARLQDDIAEIETKIAEVEKKLDDEKTPEGEKEQLEKSKEDLEAQVEKIEESYDPKVEKFVALVREESAKVDEKKKKTIAPAVVNMRRAVDEAKNNNSVALLRYPMAVTGLHNELEPTAKRIVADVIEEQVGKRPDMTSLKPEVKLEGTDVKLSLNGLSPSDLASMSIDEILEETTLRMGGYVGRVMILIGYADETQRKLDFQAQVLDAWLEGMKIDQATFAGAGENLKELKVESGPAAGGKNAKVAIDASKLGKFMPGGVRTSACSLKKKKAKEPEPETEVAAVEEEPAKDKAKSAKDKPAKDKPAKTADKPAKDKPAKTADKPKAGSSKDGSPSGQPSGKPTAQPTKPASEGSSPPSGSDPGRCDIVVTTAEGSVCM